MNASDLPSLDTVIDPTSVIPQEEIDRINDLYSNMRRKGRQILKEAMEIGDWMTASRTKMGPHVKWASWLKEKFPKIPLTSIWNFQKLAANREYIDAFMRNEPLPSVRESIRILSQRDKMAKPRVRAVVVSADAPPDVLLQAKLKNYVISLWQLRYLQTEIEGLIEAMKLKPDQMLKVLHYVCKEHHEVEDEVVRTFKPNLKVVKKGA